MNQRIQQLDSVRGLAALSVVISHMLLVKTEIFTESMRTPLRFFTNGHAAVILFFVLSGFVLSVPLFKKDRIDYLPYLIKRVFRIYVPYLIAISAAMISSVFFYQDKIIALSDWFNHSWMQRPNIKLIGEHIFVIRDFHSDFFDGVIWSLVHELRISLIFPFVIVLIKRLDFKISLLICMFLSMFPVANHVFHFQAGKSVQPTTYFDTLHYVALFILGALLAKHKETFVHLFRSLTRKGKWLFFVMSIVMYDFSTGIGFVLSKFQMLHPFLLVLEEYGEAIGAMALIIIALGSYKATRFLSFKALSFLGQISYSVYLYHIVVLLACVHLFYKMLPLGYILVLSFVLTIVVSTLAYNLIEVPSMRMGRKLASMIKPERKTVLFIPTSDKQLRNH